VLDLWHSFNEVQGTWTDRKRKRQQDRANEKSFSPSLSRVVSLFVSLFYVQRLGKLGLQHWLYICTHTYIHIYVFTLTQICASALCIYSSAFFFFACLSLSQRLRSMQRVYTYIYTHIRTCMYTNQHNYAQVFCAFTSVHVFLLVCLSRSQALSSLGLQQCVYIYIYTHTHMYVHTYMHTNTVVHRDFVQ